MLLARIHVAELGVDSSIRYNTQGCCSAIRRCFEGFLVYTGADQSGHEISTSVRPRKNKLSYLFMD